MPKCPNCNAEFSNQKLLAIHQKYCKHKKTSNSDANFTTEKIHRSAVLGESPKSNEGKGIEDTDSPLSISSEIPADTPSPQETKNILETSDMYEDSKGRLRLSVKTYEGILLVKVAGDLVVWTSLHLNSAIKKILSSGGKLVILEVSEVKDCDAAGLGALLLFNQELKDRQGRLALSAPKNEQDKFECIKGFTRVVEFFPNLDLAVKSFLDSKNKVKQ